MGKAWKPQALLALKDISGWKVVRSDEEEKELVWRASDESPCGPGAAGTGARLSELSWAATLAKSHLRCGRRYVIRQRNHGAGEASVVPEPVWVLISVTLYRPGRSSSAARAFNVCDRFVAERNEHLRASVPQREHE